MWSCRGPVAQVGAGSQHWAAAALRAQRGPHKRHAAISCCGAAAWPRRQVSDFGQRFNQSPSAPIPARNQHRASLSSPRTLTPFRLPCLVPRQTLPKMDGLHSTVRPPVSAPLFAPFRACVWRGAYRLLAVGAAPGGAVPTGLNPFKEGVEPVIGADEAYPDWLKVPLPASRPGVCRRIAPARALGFLCGEL